MSIWLLDWQSHSFVTIDPNAIKNRHPKSREHNSILKGLQGIVKNSGYSKYKTYVRIRYCHLMKTVTLISHSIYSLWTLSPYLTLFSTPFLNNSHQASVYLLFVLIVAVVDVMCLYCQTRMYKLWHQFSHQSSLRREKRLMGCFSFSKSEHSKRCGSK